MLSIFRRAAPATWVRAVSCPRCIARRWLASPHGSALVIGLLSAAPLATSRAQAVPAMGRVAAPPPAEAARTSAALDSLVRQALQANPAIHAAGARLKAADARVAPAGARPDPMLMAGIENLPISEPGFSDFMTMKVIGVEQAFPFPGKLSLRTRAARDEVAAAQAALDAARLDAATQTKEAYYDLAFADRALDIVRRNQAVLTDLISVSEARYATGTGTQADVLRARTETANLESAASALAEQRRAALARLNAVLDRPSDTPVEAPVIPARIARAAVADSASQVHFASGGLGARAADSPLLPLDSAW